jgi:hypothetical protein
MSMGGACGISTVSIVEVLIRAICGDNRNDGVSLLPKFKFYSRRSG